MQRRLRIRWETLARLPPFGLSCTLDLYIVYLLILTGPTVATGLSGLLGGALSHDHITR